MSHYEDQREEQQIAYDEYLRLLRKEKPSVEERLHFIEERLRRIENAIFEE